MRKLVSIALGVLVALCAAVAMAVVLAILEIYLAGHGHPTMMDRIVFDDPGSGTRLSMADVIALVISAASGVAATWLHWPAGHHRAD